MSYDMERSVSPLPPVSGAAGTNDTAPKRCVRGSARNRDSLIHVIQSVNNSCSDRDTSSAGGTRNAMGKPLVSTRARWSERSSTPRDAQAGRASRLAGQQEIIIDARHGTALGIKDKTGCGR